MKYTSKLLHFAAVALYTYTSGTKSIVLPEVTALTKSGILSKYSLIAGADASSREGVEKELHIALQKSKRNTGMSTEILPGMSTEKIIFKMPEFANDIHYDVLININNFYTIIRNPTTQNTLVLKLIFRLLYPFMEQTVLDPANAPALQNLRDNLTARVARDKITVASCVNELEQDIFDGQASESTNILGRLQFLAYVEKAVDELDKLHGIPAKNLATLENEPMQRPYQTLITNNKEDDTTRFKQAIFNAFKYTTYPLDLICAYRDTSGDTTYCYNTYAHNNFQNIICACYVQLLARSLAYHTILKTTAKQTRAKDPAQDIVDIIMKAPINTNPPLYPHHIAALLRNTIYDNRRTPELDDLVRTLTKPHMSSLLSILCDEVRALMTSPYMMKYNQMPEHLLHETLQSRTKPDQSTINQTSNIPSIHTCICLLTAYGTETPCHPLSKQPMHECTVNTARSLRSIIFTSSSKFLIEARQYAKNKIFGLTQCLAKRTLINMSPVLIKNILESSELMLSAINEYTYLSGGESMQISAKNIVSLPYSLQPLLFTIMFQTERFNRKYLTTKSVPLLDNNGIQKGVKSITTIASLFLETSVFSKDTKNNPWLKLAEDFFGKYNQISFFDLLAPEYNIDNNCLGIKIYRRIIEILLNIVSVTKYGYVLQTTITYQIATPALDKDFDTTSQEYQYVRDNISSDIRVTHNLESIINNMYADYKQAVAKQAQTEAILKQAQEAYTVANDAVQIAKTSEDKNAEKIKTLKDQKAQAEKVLQVAQQNHQNAIARVNDATGMLHKDSCIIYNNIIFLLHAHECSTPEELTRLMNTATTKRDIQIPTNLDEFVTYLRDQLNIVIPEELLNFWK